MKTISILTSIIAFSLTIVPGFSQNYEISISMKTGNDTVLLGHIFAMDGTGYRDTTIILKNGKGVIKGNKLLPKGLYSIYNNRKKLDFLIGHVSPLRPIIYLLNDHKEIVLKHAQADQIKSYIEATSKLYLF